MTELPCNCDDIPALFMTVTDQGGTCSCADETGADEPIALNCDDANDQWDAPAKRVGCSDLLGVFNKICWDRNVSTLACDTCTNLDCDTIGNEGASGQLPTAGKFGSGFISPNADPTVISCDVDPFEYIFDATYTPDANFDTTCSAGSSDVTLRFTVTE